MNSTPMACTAFDSNEIKYFSFSGISLTCPECERNDLKSNRYNYIIYDETTLACVSYKCENCKTRCERSYNTQNSPITNDDLYAELIVPSGIIEDVFITDKMKSIAIGVKSESELNDYAKSINAYVNPVANRKEGVKGIYDKKTDQLKEIWINPKQKNYAQVYIKDLEEKEFYKNRWDSTTGNTLNDDIDIDHVFPSSIAKEIDFGFVRLFPVSKKANRSCGSHEKVILSNLDKDKQNRSPIKFIDVIGVAKLLNMTLETPSTKGNEQIIKIHLNKHYLEISDSEKDRILKSIGVMWWN